MAQTDNNASGPSVLGAVISLVGLAAFVVWLVRLVRHPVQTLNDHWQGYTKGWSAATGIVTRNIPLIEVSIVSALAAGIAVAFFALLWSLTRLRRVRVFLSHHHSLGNQVERLAAALASAGAQPVYLRFCHAPEHDALLEEIYRSIRRSDIFVCLPGDGPSFVEAEVTAAVFAQKPILILLPENNNGRPDTGFLSYPVLDLARLEAEEYRPLCAFIAYLWGGPRATWRLLARLTPPPATVLGWTATALFIGFMGLGAWLTVRSLLALFAAPFEQAYFDAFKNGGLLAFMLTSICGLLVLLIAISPLAAVTYRWVARRTLQRRMNKGGYTYRVFKPVLERSGLRHVVPCFFAVSPLAHNQIASTT